jgi:hypothetical protein
VFWTFKIQKNILILIGIISLSYVLIFLLAPKDLADYTVADTEYWRETENRLLLKTAYEYNSKQDIQAFPRNLGDWKSYDYRYPDAVYAKMNADILLSRAYTSGYGSLVWMDIINSKVGESFHKQRICVEGAGWTVENESIAEFRIADPPNPFTKLYANRLDISKKDKKQVMVYWFMFKKFGENDAVTMIRLSSPVVYNETATFDSMKSFVENQLFNAMYERSLPENITVAEYMIREYGKTGILAITLVILAPLGILFIGIRQKD